MLYLILAAAGFFIQNTSGDPVPGAWVGARGMWFGSANSNGYYTFAGEEPDTLSIHATGFGDWTGSKPWNGQIVRLRETVFYTGEFILVTGSRGPLSGVIPSTTMLYEDDTAELSRSGMNSLNGMVPGITVREYGGSMPVVSLSIRGADPSQVDHMIDGVSMVSARDGMPTGLFDPAVFASVEVARGGSATGNGGSGSAGAINYLPPLSSQPLSVSMSALSSGAAYFTGKHRGSAISIRRNIGNKGTEGISTTFLTAGRYRNVKLGFLGGWASGDVEGPTWSAASDGEREQAQAEGWATLVHDNYEVDISAGAGFMDYLQTEPFNADDSHRDLTIRTSLLWNGPVIVQGGFNSAWLTSTATDDHAVRSGTVHVSKRHRFLYANLGCLLGTDKSIQLSGRATVDQQVIRNLTLHSSVFSDHRIPTVNDLYWPSDGYTSGNPDLRNERSTGVETGGAWRGDGITGEICGFVTISDDLIIWLPDGSGVWSPSNISSSISKGVELSGSVDLGTSSFSGTYTWNIATDETENTPREGMLLPYRPEYTWGLSAESTAPLEIETGVDLAGMGKRFTNRTQSEYLAEYFIINGTAGRQITAQLSVELGVGNILDTSYEETNGYEGRGRTLRLTFEYTGE
ncbi:MAG: TonB-dependent receptor [Candidatus Sabulitectum sp.]|nr:TonB-dependent receptor [Candidatus Sabulitectum sp.]